MTEMVDNAGNNLAALGAAMTLRRRQLGVTQTDVGAVKNGVSSATIKHLERGKPAGKMYATTLRSIDRAFQWPPGTAIRIARGEINPRDAVVTADVPGWPTPDGVWGAYVTAQDKAARRRRVGEPAKETTLADFSDDELLAEIARRFVRGTDGAN